MKGLKAAFDASAETANEITEARAVCNFVVDATGDSVNDIKPEKIMGIITTNVDKGDTESLQHVLWRGIYETVRRYGGTTPERFGRRLVYCRKTFEDFLREVPAPDD